MVVEFNSPEELVDHFRKIENSFRYAIKEESSELFYEAIAAMYQCYCSLYEQRQHMLKQGIVVKHTLFNTAIDIIGKDPNSFDAFFLLTSLASWARDGDPPILEWISVKQKELVNRQPSIYAFEEIELLNARRILRGKEQQTPYGKKPKPNQSYPNIATGDLAFMDLSDDENDGFRYLSSKEKKLLKIRLNRNNQLTRFGTPVNATSYTYVISLKGGLYIYDDNILAGRFRGDPARHSVYKGGQPVICAGHIEIENGRIIAISNHSGHYTPSDMQLRNGAIWLYSCGMLDKDCKLQSYGRYIVPTVGDIIEQYPLLTKYINNNHYYFFQSMNVISKIDHFLKIGNQSISFHDLNTALPKKEEYLSEETILELEKEQYPDHYTQPMLDQRALLEIREKYSRKALSYLKRYGFSLSATIIKDWHQNIPEHMKTFAYYYAVIHKDTTLLEKLLLDSDFLKNTNHLDLQYAVLDYGNEQILSIILQHDDLVSTDFIQKVFTFAVQNHKTELLKSIVKSKYARELPAEGPYGLQMLLYYAASWEINDIIPDILSFTHMKQVPIKERNGIAGIMILALKQNNTLLADTILRSEYAKHFASEGRYSVEDMLPLTRDVDIAKHIMQLECVLHITPKAWKNILSQSNILVFKELMKSDVIKKILKEDNYFLGNIIFTTNKTTILDELLKQPDAISELPRKGKYGQFTLLDQAVIWGSPAIHKTLNPEYEPSAFARHCMASSNVFKMVMQSISFSVEDVPEMLNILMTALKKEHDNAVIEILDSDYAKHFSREQLEDILCLSKNDTIIKKILELPNAKDISIKKDTRLFKELTSMRDSTILKKILDSIDVSGETLGSMFHLTHNPEILKHQNADNIPLTGIDGLGKYLHNALEKSDMTKVRTVLSSEQIKRFSEKDMKNIIKKYYKKDGVIQEIFSSSYPKKSELIQHLFHEEESEGPEHFNLISKVVETTTSLPETHPSKDTLLSAISTFIHNAKPLQYGWGEYLWTDTTRNGIYYHADQGKLHYFEEGKILASLPIDTIIEQLECRGPSSKLGSPSTNKVDPINREKGI